MEEGEQISELMESYLPEKGTDREIELMSPILHITKNYPPTFVMTCYRFYKWSEKTLGHVFHCDMRLDMAEKCNADECDFFGEFLLS